MKKVREYLQNKKKGAVRQTGSTATLAGLGVAGAHMLPLEFFENAREAAYLGRHAGKAAYDAAVGGPEGMRSAKNLDEALGMVKSAAEWNAEAREIMDAYGRERQEFNSELLETYQDNETIARTADRVRLQLEGVLKNTFEAGNELKPGFMKRVDDAIIKLYGQDPTEAREKSTRVKQFYKEVREFYDAREQNEHTVKEFCDHLAEVKEESIAQNQRYNELFPEVIARVKEGYETEDGLFETGERNIVGLRSDVRPSELEKVDANVSGYQNRVENTQAVVGSEMPIAPYEKPQWIDWGINPVSIGIAAGVAAKGLLRLVPGKGVRRTIGDVLALPVTAPYALAKKGMGMFWNKQKRDFKGHMEKAEEAKTINSEEGIE